MQVYRKVSRLRHKFGVNARKIEDILIEYTCILWNNQLKFSHSLKFFLIHESSFNIKIVVAFWKCMCRLQNIAMHDYQDGGTTRQIDAGQSDHYMPLCFAGNTKIKLLVKRLVYWPACNLQRIPDGNGVNDLVTLTLTFMLKTVVLFFYCVATGGIVFHKHMTLYCWISFITT